MIDRTVWLNVRDREAFARLTGVQFLGFLAVGLWAPLLPVYIRALGGDAAQIGLVLATFQATSLASQYWWGRISDWLGRRKPLLLLGTAGLAVAYLGIASVDHYGWLFAVRAVEGVVLAAYSTGGLALIGDVLEDEASRGRLMGFYRMFGSLAFAIGALSGGWLSDSFSQRVPLFAAAGCYALACALSSSIKERAQDAGRKTKDERPAIATEIEQAQELRHSSSVFGHQKNRALWSFMGLVFTWMFATMAVISLWPVYMSTLGYSQTAIGGLWALAALGEAPCMLLAGYLADRWGRKWVMLLGMAAMGAVFLGYTLSVSLAWFVAVQLVRSLAYSCFEAPSLLYATELGLRQQRGRLAGLYYSASGVGSTLGSAAGGAAAQEFGVPLMFRGVVAIMLATVVIVARVMPRLRPPTPEPAAVPAIRDA